MAITFIAAAIPALNPLDSFTITIPTVQVGDLLTLDFFDRDNEVGPTVVDNDTTGELWTLGFEQAGIDRYIATFYKRATAATSGKTITVTAVGGLGGIVGALSVYRGALATGSPYDGTPVAESNASGDETQAQITTLTDAAFVVLAVGLKNNLAIASQACTSPGTLTERAEKQIDNVVDCTIAVASAEKATAGATGAFTWAHLNIIGMSLAYAIKPAAGGAFEITADAGAYAITGTAAQLEYDRIFVAEAGAYALTGTDAALNHGRLLQAEAGSYAITGTDASLQANRIFLAAAGSYTITGADASLQAARIFVAGGGSYAIVGSDANLVHTPVSGEGGGGSHYFRFTRKRRR